MINCKVSIGIGVSYNQITEITENTKYKIETLSFGQKLPNANPTLFCTKFKSNVMWFIFYVHTTVKKNKNLNLYENTKNNNKHNNISVAQSVT